MSVRHLLDSEGAVRCGASAAPDGSNVTSDFALSSCVECCSAQPGEYIADWGDWVRMADGRAATVVKANAAVSKSMGSGAYYTLMFKGGTEKTYYHWEGADHLVEDRWTGEKVTVPLFTVVSQEG